MAGAISHLYILDEYGLFGDANSVELGSGAGKPLHTAHCSGPAGADAGVKWSC